VFSNTGKILCSHEIPGCLCRRKPYEFYDTEEAEKALKCSSKIIEFVRKRYDEQVGKAEKGREGKSS